MNNLIIGIAGGSGSGKTTLACRLKALFGEDEVRLISHDSYYKRHDELPFEERCKLNYDHPDAFDNALLIYHLQELKAGRAIDCPVYDYADLNRSNEVQHIEPAPVLIVEGILPFVEPELCAMFDYKIFVDTDADERILRRLVRDVKERGRSLDSVINQYLTVLHAGIARSPALAGKGHVVPSLFERLGEDPGILGKMTDVITRLAQLPRVASREQRRTRRRRFRIRSVTILEQHTPCGHTVENRRRDPLAAISPEMKPCGIVGDAEQNIRTAHRIILPVNRDQSAQCGGSPKYKITSHRSHIVYCKIPGGPERRRGVTNLHWQYNGCRTGRLSRSSPKWHLPTVRY